MRKGIVYSYFGTALFLWAAAGTRAVLEAHPRQVKPAASIVWKINALAPGLEVEYQAWEDPDPLPCAVIVHPGEIEIQSTKVYAKDPSKSDSIYVHTLVISKDLRINQWMYETQKYPGMHYTFTGPKLVEQQCSKALHALPDSVYKLIEPR